uniref:Conserved plasma membrane protein n=1 Tax=Macrostomum lignano TaxID=282301 RepID=A0A1I8H5L8_9PLAT
SDSQRQIMSYNSNIKRAVQALRPQERASFMTNNFVKIIVFYDDPVMYWSVSTPAYQIIDVLSDMGGQVGLWLGLSVLTLCEIVEMLVDLLFLCTHRALQRKKPSNSDYSGGGSGRSPVIKGAKVGDSSTDPHSLQASAGWYDMPPVEK